MTSTRLNWIFLFLVYCFSLNCHDNKYASLKILYVLDEFPKFNQPFVLNQIVGLVELGHDIWILADHERYPEMIPRAVREYHLLEKTWYKRPPASTQHFDIICCNFGQNGCWAAKLIHDRKITGKLVTIFQGADATKLPLYKAGKTYSRIGDYNIMVHNQDMYKELFNIGSAFLGVCEYFEEKIIALGASRLKTGTHHNGIDCKKFQFKERQYTPGKPINLVTVGRLVEKKGIKFAIEAIARVINEGYNVNFTIIGDGPDKTDLEKIAKRLKINKKVKFLGWKTQEEVAKFLDKSHIFILPSVTAQSEQYLGDQEGMPTVLMEAMAMGLPTVSTFHSGIPELVIDGVTGCLAKERNVDELVQCIIKLISKPNAWAEMGKKARSVVERNCNTRIQNEKLIALFYSLINEK